MNRIRGYFIAMHCLCWLIFFSIPALFVAGQSDSINLLTLFSNSAWLFFLVFVVIFYFHTYLFFPRLYFRKKYLLYFIALFAMAASVIITSPYDRVARISHRNHEEMERKFFEKALQQPAFNSDAQITKLLPEFRTGLHKHKRLRFDIISAVLFFLIIAVSIALVVIKRWQEDKERAAKAEAEKTKAELTALKAQINPHFLFNTLNNIYSQAVMHDESTAESIMKLSNIMRYITDDANNDFVSLKSESNFISNYIELQRMRLGSRVMLDFAINGKLENKVIAPLILITFIENVFKYGISNKEPGTITIELRAYDDSIAFFTRNKLYPYKNNLESTGIGITNTRKRLNLLYPGKHTLTIKEDDGYYSVHLILQS